MTLKLHRVECRAVVATYDDDGRLISEDVSQHVQGIWQLEQFVAYWEALELEVEQRNLDQEREKT